jgi:CRISPR/Cas system CSM-associated protein Csm3 (group 7 of RAMP superfamily)
MKPQRLDLTYRIHWESSWHVGSGYASAAVDRLIRRFGAAVRVPFVPGSLIKGVLRHQCERLVSALGLDAVDPHATSKEQEKQLVRHFQPLADSTLVVDRLFGSRYQGECLFLDNATPSTGVPANESDGPTSGLRTRTAMDRVTGTALEGHLFTTEMAYPGTPLTGRLRARHPAGVLTQDGEQCPFEYAVLIASLLSLDTLGGNKSAGAGRCQVSIPDRSLWWNGQPLDIPEALRSFEVLEGDWTEWVQAVRAERESP